MPGQLALAGGLVLLEVREPAHAHQARAAVGLDGDERLPDEALVLGEGLHRRGLPGRVTVEGVDDLAAELVVVHQQPSQQADVVRRQTGAAGGDRGGHTGLRIF
mgnify:CR=1 FL=1